ncbi:hypothetical protein GWI33_011572 [Rhynchophorus ferrugineus]|uniref:Uncharacterized protein n=1 Tax=Rhynchophorus ferrugineus TaxID=354439 RepID=A0A834IBH3_RHYFE|nr:hypothetical protein GWI33_011572 [Rhynchophorus ferrugineus]
MRNFSFLFRDVYRGLDAKSCDKAVSCSVYSSTWSVRQLIDWSRAIVSNMGSGERADSVNLKSGLCGNVVIKSLMNLQAPTVTSSPPSGAYKKCETPINYIYIRYLVIVFLLGTVRYGPARQAINTILRSTFHAYVLKTGPIILIPHLSQAYVALKQ